MILSKYRDKIIIIMFFQFSFYFFMLLFSGQIEISGVFLHTSFTILENQPMDMLLGLDMLKRHQVSVLVTPC